MFGFLGLRLKLKNYFVPHLALNLFLERGRGGGRTYTYYGTNSNGDC